VSCWQTPFSWAMKEERTSFLKKRSKKLLDYGTRVAAGMGASMQKFFGSFFQKRTAFF
jgi:hypothetical protein